MDIVRDVRRRTHARASLGETAAMPAQDQHAMQRHDSVLVAAISIAGDAGTHQIQVRNLSAGGMMGEGAVAISRGSSLEIDLPNVGSVAGTVAWVQDDRFGVAFASEIEPEKVFGKANVVQDRGAPENGGVDGERRSSTRLQ